MDPTGSTSDGILFGAQDVTLGSTTWRCSAFSLRFPTNAIDSNDSFGVWTGSAYRDQKGTGSATLMYPTQTAPMTGGVSSTVIALPARRTAFTAKSKGGTVYHLIITEVGENQGGEEPTVAVSLAELKNYSAGTGGSGS